jgi:hypothetical protein
LRDARRGALAWGATQAESKGYPEDWYSLTGVRMDGRAGCNYGDYVYHNGQLASALWFEILYLAESLTGSATRGIRS